MPKMHSIHVTARLCKEKNIGISPYNIRQLALNGEIPAVRSGNRILINFDGLIDYLNENRLNDANQENNRIRRIKK